MVPPIDREKKTNTDSLDEPEENEPALTWLSEGLALSQRVLVVAFSLGIPILAGAGLDHFLPLVPQVPVGVLAGCFFGMMASGWQLWRLAQWLAARTPKGPSRSRLLDTRRNQNSEKRREERDGS